MAALQSVVVVANVASEAEVAAIAKYMDKYRIEALHDAREVSGQVESKMNALFAEAVKAAHELVHSDRATLQT